MKWKTRYSTKQEDFVPKIGMIFIDNPNSDKSEWETDFYDPGDTEYTLISITEGDNNPIHLRYMTNGSWSMDEKFLKEHFILVREK